MRLIIYFLIILPAIVFAGNPQSAAEFTERAQNRLQSGDTLSALSDLSEAILKDNKYIESYRLRARLFLDTKKFQPALNDYNELIRRSPSDMTAYGERAGIKEYFEDFTGAESDYLKDLEYNPDKITSLEGVCRMKLDQTLDYNGVLPYINTLIKIHPERPDYLFLKGQAMQNLNKLSEAISIYNEVEKKDPSIATLYFFRGMAYLNLEKKKEACADFSKAKSAGLTFADAIISKNCQ